MSKTLDNLKTAFAGESQANRKYLNFAQKAEDEGFSGVAKLFRVAAEGETVHAHRHLVAMKGIGSTEENLRASIGGETEEFTNMYPKMIKTAEEENDSIAQDAFEDANTIEKEHAKLYNEALSDPKAFEIGRVWVCQNCGHVHIGEEAPDKCPVCGWPQNKFKEVE